MSAGSIASADSIVSAGTLDQVLQELEQQLQLRLAEIETDCQSRIHLLEKQMRAALNVDTEKRAQDHSARLAQLRRKRMRDVRAQQQQAIWNCQRDCIEQIQSHSRQSLSKMPPDRHSLGCWIEAARSRLRSPKKMKLKLKPEWIEALERGEIPVEASPMLGGAILQDTERHLEVDGSWDQRLERLAPELWEKWYQLVGKNHQD